IGMSLAIKKSQLNAAQDEYFWSDLIDMVVINQQGVELGQVKGLIETGANDVLQVVNTNDKTEYLVPFVPEVIVLNVDKSAGRIDVDWQRDY
ncbi:MAG TPA: 16S rRNA processing protein RimM, partial [Gammaproteobacteria bacterium]|nr:16S rRNA processing protein RimM [Gammaproteobacteria bacterium]